MNHYFVGPTTKPDWAFGQAELRRRLLERWPELEQHGSGELLHFEFPGLESVMEISIDAEGGCLTFRGWGERMPEIVAWFRAQAPADEEIVYADGSGALSLVLEPGITAAEVRRREEETWRS